MQNFLKFLKFIFRILYNIMANDFVNEEYKDRLRNSARIGKKIASKNLLSYCFLNKNFLILISKSTGSKISLINFLISFSRERSWPRILFKEICLLRIRHAISGWIKLFIINFKLCLLNVLKIYFFRNCLLVPNKF